MLKTVKDSRKRSSIDVNSRNELFGLYLNELGGLVEYPAVKIKLLYLKCDITRFC